MLVHQISLAAEVLAAHHTAIFIGLFQFCQGLTQACVRYQKPLTLKEGLFVGFFLAGLAALTANAAHACLGALMEGISG